MKRIIVTGGSGIVGQHIISVLLKKGYDVVNLDLVALPPHLAAQVHTIKVDLTNAGSVFSAFVTPFHLTQPIHEPALAKPDAVVHLAGYPRNTLVPDTETYRVNTLSTFNVLEAAAKLGVKKVILASSICVYGVTYAQGEVDFPSFPVDETVDANPMDVYSISKVCGERTARGFSRKYGMDIYAFRIGAVITPEIREQEYRNYVDFPESWKVHGWSYTDAIDLGNMTAQALERNQLGFQVFNAVNDEITNNCASTSEFLQEQCPHVPITKPMGPREAPISNAKAKELLGFREEHSWRLYYKP